MLNGFEIIFPFVQKTSPTAALKSHSTHETFLYLFSIPFLFLVLVKIQEKNLDFFFIQSLRNSFLAIYLPELLCILHFWEISFENTNQDFRFSKSAREAGLMNKVVTLDSAIYLQYFSLFGPGDGDWSNKYILIVIWHSRCVEGVPSSKFLVWFPRGWDINRKCLILMARRLLSNGSGMQGKDIHVKTIRIGEMTF